MSEDALWPRAASWLVQASGDTSQLGLIGVPAFKTSLSQTSANQTPKAIRLALSRYSTFSWSEGLDLRDLSFQDFGDSEDPDSAQGEERTIELAQIAKTKSDLLIALGGDNSISYAVMRGVMGENLKDSALITLDAHHDLRDGISNGSPVRRLIEAGLEGRNIVQIGINDFSNSPQYAKRAKEMGIHVIPRSELRGKSPKEVFERALGEVGDKKIYVDIDMDVCDRSVVPACPASAPGGISADELRQFAFEIGKARNVVGVDITEIDAGADAPDGRTVRLAALAILELAAGFAKRT